MIHHRQCLSLGLESRDNTFGIHAQLDDLERHAATDRFFLFGHINHAAAAFANLLEQFVVANLVAGFFGERNAYQHGSLEVETCGRCRQKTFGLLVRV
jgi:hypothetical protein